MNPNKSKFVLILRESNVIMGLKRVHIHKEKQKMKEIKLQVEDYVYEFYKNIGICAGGKSTEQVMTDALFRLAGETKRKAEEKNIDPCTSLTKIHEKFLQKRRKKCLTYGAYIGILIKRECEKHGRIMR